MKFGAFVMTFNRPEILRRTIEAILSQSRPPDHILVVDNGDPVLTRAALHGVGGPLVTHYSMGENTGPAGATAYGLQRLVDQGYDWIYWVDDDDPPETPDTLERLMKLASEAPEDVGGIGGVGHLFDWNCGEIRRLPDSALFGILSVDIIAGNQQFILRREAVQAVGVNDARLFFGLYEPEYCLRLRRGGYRLLVDGEYMYQRRQQHQRLNFARSRAWIPDYALRSVWQRYYRTRNYIHMMRSTFDRPDLARREVCKSVGRMVTSWLRGPRYGMEFTSLQVRGIIDGYAGRLGRTVVPKPKYD